MWQGLFAKDQVRSIEKNEKDSCDTSPTSSREVTCPLLEIFYIATIQPQIILNIKIWDLALKALNNEFLTAFEIQLHCWF